MIENDFISLLETSKKEYLLAALLKFFIKDFNDYLSKFREIYYL